MINELLKSNSTLTTLDLGSDEKDKRIKIHDKEGKETIIRNENVCI